jgi:hypothetical protein
MIILIHFINPVKILNPYQHDLLEVFWLKLANKKIVPRAQDYFLCLTNIDYFVFQLSFGSSNFNFVSFFSTQECRA